MADKRRLLIAVAGGALVCALAIRGPVEWRAWQDRQLKSRSVAQLEAFAAANPKHANARYYLAMAYVRDGQVEKAPRYFREALVLDPVRADILNDLGAVYLLQRRYYESLVALQGATTAQPDFAPAWANLGRLHIAMEMAYTATAELKKANQLAPGNVEVLADLGEACRRTLNYKGAEAAYQEAIALKPDHVRAHTGLALVLQEKGKYDEALAILEKADRLSPDDPGVLATIGSIYLKKGTTAAEWAQCEKYLRKALELDPTLADAWISLGNFELLRGKPKDAIDPLTQAITLAPEHMGALNLLERALRRSGRVAEADRAAKVFRERALRDREETVMEERTSRDPEDWDAIARLAELYLLTNKRYKAVWMTNRLKEGAPYHPKLPKLLQAVGPSASPAAGGGF